MADVNVQIKQRNGEIWDNIYPKTKAELVIETTDKKFVSDAEKAAWSAKQTALGFTPENPANKNKANGYAGLDSTGKINAGQLPAIAITDTFIVDNQAGMLALDAQVGDIAVRRDINKSFVLKTAGATVLANWTELLTPNSPVQSVAGKTGAVTLVPSDVGLGNVTNESKTTMFTSPTFTGTPVAPTAAVGTSTTQVATTAFVIGQAGTTAPKVNGTAAIGTSTKYAREDHVHGTDTSRAPLASPAFTGVPTAPTATTGTSTTQIATTAYVVNEAWRQVTQAKADLEYLIEEKTKITVSPSEPLVKVSGDFWYQTV